MIDEQREEKEKIYQSIEANTQFNVVTPIKQIVCTSTREAENFIKREHKKKHLYLLLRRLQAL